MLRMDMNSMNLLFVSDFKKVAFKRRKGKQMIFTKNMKLNPNISTKNNPILQYYNHLLEEGFTKSHAAILALLLRQKVIGINLRAKSVRVFFEDNSHLKIDLTSPELVDVQEELLHTIINHYKSERERSIQKAFQTKNQDICFERNMRDNRSFSYQKENQLVCELMCNERSRMFQFGEEKVVAETIEKFIDENDGLINITKASRQPTGLNEGISSLEGPMPIIDDFMFLHGKDRNIILDGLPYNILEQTEIAVDRHNDQIKDLENTKSYVKTKKD